MQSDIKEIHLSVIIPTYNRMNLLPSLLESWMKVNAVSKYDYEIIFSDDGSQDNTLQVLAAAAPYLPIRIIQNQHGGPARARNAAILAARGNKILMLGDDIYPNPDLINQHYEKLLEVGRTNAVLGRVTWHPALEVNYLMRHITEIGNQQFSFNHLIPHTFADYKYFYTCNISIDRGFLIEEKILFDERFTKCNFEDIELGYRLEQRGLQLYYFPEAIGFHYHPYTLKGYCQRMQNAGEMSLVFERLHPEFALKSGSRSILNQYILFKRILTNRKCKELSLNAEKMLEQLINKYTVLEPKNYNSVHSRLLAQKIDKLFSLFFSIGILEAQLPDNNYIKGLTFVMHYQTHTIRHFIFRLSLAGQKLIQSLVKLSLKVFEND